VEAVPRRVGGRSGGGCSAPPVWFGLFGLVIRVAAAAREKQRMSYIYKWAQDGPPVEESGFD
jgi:hypothetical protein